MKDPEIILKDNPGSVVFAPYADVLARSGKIERALEILRKGIQANPFYAPGYSVLAELLFQQNSPGEAADALRSALKIDPQRPRDLLRLGNHFLESDPLESQTLLWAARVFEPQSAQVSALFTQAGEHSYPYEEGETDQVITEQTEEEGDGELLEFGVVDEDEKDSDGVKILEINEEEEYDLSRFLFETATKDDTPVLSEQEREELMSLASSDKAEHGEGEEDEAEEKKAEEEKEDTTGEPDLPGLPDEDSVSPIQEGYYGKLSSEEIDVLSTMDKASQETDLGLEREIREGIDYSDVLSTWGKGVDSALESKPAEIPLSSTSHDPLWKEEEEDKEDTLGIEDEITGKEASSFPVADEVLNGVEDKIPPAPENEASLDSLINEYLKVLKKKPAVSETVGISPLKPVTPLSTRKPSPVLEKEKESQTGAALSDTGSYTATMAEIYISQGLVSRAIEIYTVLLDRDPENEHIRSRLQELENPADLQGDVS